MFTWTGVGASPATCRGRRGHGSDNPFSVTGKVKHKHNTLDVAPHQLISVAQTHASQQCFSIARCCSRACEDSKICHANINIKKQGCKWISITLVLYKNRPASPFCGVWYEAADEPSPNTTLLPPPGGASTREEGRSEIRLPL